MVGVLRPPWVCWACDLAPRAQLWHPCSFTLCGDHEAEKLEAFRTAARPHDVLGQRLHDLLELGFPEESVIAGLQLHEQVSMSSFGSRAGAWQLYAAFTASPAVLRQYDAMLELVDAGFASGVGGQDDEGGRRQERQPFSAPAQEADKHLCSCASPLRSPQDCAHEAQGWRLPGPTRRKESGGQQRLSVEQDVLQEQENVSILGPISRGSCGTSVGQAKDTW